MTDITTQLLLFGVGAVLSFTAFLLFVANYLFKKYRAQKYGIIAAWAAAFPVTLALILRWVQAGHFPFLGGYELLSSCAGVLLLFYLFIQLWRPVLRGTGIIVLPITFLMIGLAMTGSTETVATPKSYFTIWLWIHILSAVFAFASVIISGSLSFFYLSKNRQEARGQVSDFLSKLPSLEKLDFLNNQFASLAFIMQGIMIAAGSIWAYRAWGRYWAWDPIETWSLISWLVYGAYQHLRLMGVRGKAVSWLGITAILLVIFALFGAPVLYSTIHETLNLVK